MTEHHAAPRIPRRILLRFLALVVLVGVGFAVLRFSPVADALTVEKISVFLDRLRQAWWAPALLILAYIVLCPLGLPASVLMITGGVVFGVVRGSLYNLVGVFLGGAATYYVARALGRDLVVHLAGKRLKKVEMAIARRGFWSLVGVRFLPLPYPVVNYCCALAGVRPALFLTTTLIGVAPIVILFSYFADALSRAATGDRGGVMIRLAVASLLLLAATLVPQVVNARKRRARYRRLRAERQPPPPSPS
jgi:uncharacterized membrane protein YdjX (TVP38/TMEM64 family)